MLDCPDDLLDVIGGSAQCNLPCNRVISSPGGPFVDPARQTHAADIDDRLTAGLEAIHP
jgi:hypothetical protein